MVRGAQGFKLFEVIKGGPDSYSGTTRFKRKVGGRGGWWVSLEDHALSKYSRSWRDESIASLGRSCFLSSERESNAKLLEVLWPNG